MSRTRAVIVAAILAILAGLAIPVDVPDQAPDVIEQAIEIRPAAAHSCTVSNPTYHSWWTCATRHYVHGQSRWIHVDDNQAGCATKVYVSTTDDPWWWYYRAYITGEWSGYVTVNGAYNITGVKITSSCNSSLVHYLEWP